MFWSSTEDSPTTAWAGYSGSGNGSQIVEKSNTPSLCCVRIDSQIYVGINTNSEKERLQIISGKNNRTVSIVLDDISGDFIITIFNIQGYKVFEKQVRSSMGKEIETIDVSQFSGGLYIVKVKTGENIMTGKFVK